MVEAVRRLVRADRDLAIAEAYRRAYATDIAQDPAVAAAAAELLAETVRRDRAAGGRDDL